MFHWTRAHEILHRQLKFSIQLQIMYTFFKENGKNQLILKYQYHNRAVKSPDFFVTFLPVIPK